MCLLHNQSTRRAQTSAKAPHLQHCLCFFIFGVLRRFQHCTGHITMGSWKGRGNQYIQFARVLYCKLTNGKQIPAFPLKAMTGIEPRLKRWEARVLPLCHHGPSIAYECNNINNLFKNPGSRQLPG